MPSPLDAFHDVYGSQALTSSGPGAHQHHASEISGAFDQISIQGDIWATNWNGAVPADLSSGADANATAGFYIDATAGAIQAVTLYATGGTLGALTITDTLTIGASGTIESADGDFVVDESGDVTIDGTLTATAAEITGTIHADAGDVGGWTIGSTTLSGGDTVLSNTGYVRVGSASADRAWLSSVDATYRLWVGDDTPATAPFRVTKVGALTATSATIDGTITSSAGTIGGFTLSSSALYTGSKTAYNDGLAGVHFGTDGIGIGANVFMVTAAGALTATSGSIGAFTINTHLYTGSKTAYNDANAGVHVGSDGIGLGTGSFTVSAAGVLTCTGATVGGTINATAGTFSGNIDVSGSIRTEGGAGSSPHIKLQGQYINFVGYGGGQMGSMWAHISTGDIHIEVENSRDLELDGFSDVRINNSAAFYASGTGQFVGALTLSSIVGSPTATLGATSVTTFSASSTVQLGTAVAGFTTTGNVILGGTLTLGGSVNAGSAYWIYNLPTGNPPGAYYAATKWYVDSAISTHAALTTGVHGL